MLLERGNLVYELALVEGAARNAENAEHIIQEGVALRIKDPFLDPLSYDAFDLFRWSERYRQCSMA